IALHYGSKKKFYLVLKIYNVGIVDNETVTVAIFIENTNMRCYCCVFISSIKQHFGVGRPKLLRVVFRIIAFGRELAHISVNELVVGGTKVKTLFRWVGFGHH